MRVNWQKVLAHTGTVCTVVGLASFMQDLLAWKTFFIWLADLVSPIEFLTVLVERIASGFHVLVEIYRILVYPVFHFMFGWINVDISARVYDCIFIALTSFSAWIRSYVSLLPRVLSARAAIPPEPAPPTSQYPGFSGMFERFWDWMFEKEIYEARMLVYKQEMEAWRREVDHYRKLVASFKATVQERLDSAIKAAAVSFSLLFFVFAVDFIYVELILEEEPTAVHSPHRSN